jgi:simple sugar transport system permease protein
MTVGNELANIGNSRIVGEEYLKAGRWTATLRHPAANIVMVFAAIQLGCIVAWALFPDGFRYLEWLNIESMMRAIPLLGIVSTGVGILMICGEFDLSVGASYLLSSYLMALTYEAGWPLPLAVIVAFVTAILIGLANGFITVALRIPSFITTLGSMMFLRGMIRFVSNSEGVVFAPGGAIQSVFAGTLGRVQVEFVWFLAFALFAYLLLVRHRFGNHVYMVGGNSKAATAVGIDVGRVKVICFIISAVCAAFAGIMSAVRISAISPSGSVGLELQAIAACVVGGLSLNGGRGTAIGIALGAMLLFTIQDVLLLLRAPGYYLDMFIGVVIVVAVVMNQWVARQR